MTSIAERPTLPAAPEDYLARIEGLLPRIREAAPEIEAARQLPPEIAGLLSEAGAFSVAAPKAWGGCEFTPMVIARGIELMAAADGSTGWCAMIGCDTGYLAGFLSDEAGRELLDISAASVFVVNPLAAIAQPAEGGYTVRGRWTFVSGCTHARAYALGALVMGAAGPRMATDTLPEVRIVVVPAEKAEIIDTWTTTGVRGSGSHDLTLTDVFVPEHHSFSFFPASRTRTEPLYRQPMAFTWKMAPVALGIARGAVDDVRAMAKSKLSLAALKPIAQQTWLQTNVARAEMKLEAVRTSYYAALEEMWDAVCGETPPTLEAKARLHLAQVNAMEECVLIVDSMYRAGGSAALYAKGTLDRRLRDIHTAAQHVVFAPENVAVAGQILLGMEIEPSFTWQ